MINFFDTRKTLVDITANAHLVEIYSKGTLELELHTYQKDAHISFKKVVDLYVDLVRPFPTKMSTIFWGGNIVNFLTQKWKSDKILTVSAALV